MEIKKADSKGRVTGFKPGENYEVEVLERGRIICTPVITRAQIAEFGPEAIKQLDSAMRTFLEKGDR